MESGDCYEANFEFLQQLTNPEGAKLCHGIIEGTLELRPTGHCWLEIGDEVHDNSNGVRKCCSKDGFYACAKPKNVVKYTLGEALLHHGRFCHCGPW